MASVLLQVQTPISIAFGWTKNFRCSSVLLALTVAAFCMEPARFGYPDLSSPAIMPVYSMAPAPRHPELPPVVVFSQGDIGGYVSKEQIGVFMAGQLALLRKSNGSLGVARFGGSGQNPVKSVRDADGYRCLLGNGYTLELRFRS